MSDFLNLSDDDALHLPVPEVTVEETPSEEGTHEEPTVESQEDTPDSVEETPSENYSGTENSDNGLQAEEKTKTEVTQEGEAVDYEAAYKKLLAPFKANGREMQVANVDEAITLMQMGANYNKKMAALKPALKTVRLLEKHGLTDPDKLNTLIDAWQKNPQAIKKLISNAELDAYSISEVDDSTYSPTSRGIADEEMQLTDVFQDLMETPTYSRLVDVVTKQWDDKSKQEFVRQPEMIKAISNHLESGVFDLIDAEIQKLQVLGKLTGLSSIEAYRKVGDALHAAGRFNHLLGGTQSKPGNKAPAPDKGVDTREDVRKRKAAVSSPRSSGVSPKVPDNLLALSDEEFEKITPKFA